MILVNNNLFDFINRKNRRRDFQIKGRKTRKRQTGSNTTQKKNSRDNIKKGVKPVIYNSRTAFVSYLINRICPVVGDINEYCLTNPDNSSKLVKIRKTIDD